MWFKTRVGLFSLAEPSEILVAKSKTGEHWMIYARHTANPRMALKGWFRRIALSPPTIYLAQFTDSPTVGQAIADCMAQIEAAIRAKADICDLSQSGDAQAWRKEWKQIQWPGQNT